MARMPFIRRPSGDGQQRTTRAQTQDRAVGAGPIVQDVGVDVDAPDLGEVDHADPTFAPGPSLENANLAGPAVDLRAGDRQQEREQPKKPEEDGQKP